MSAVVFTLEANSTWVSYVVALEDRVERMGALLKRVSYVHPLHLLLLQHCEDKSPAAGGSIDWSHELYHDAGAFHSCSLCAK